MEKIKIILEDSGLYAIYKPAGIHSVGLPGGKGGESVADYILNKNADAEKISVKKEDAGIVNRLDFETSGLILAAKNRKIWNRLHKQFTEGKTQKYYYAILEGKAPDSVRLDNYTGSSGRNSKKVKVFTSKPAAKYRAQQAISSFECIDYSKKLDLSLCKIKIETGRRHQIRAHAAHIKHPLAGDRLYGSKKSLPEILKSQSPFFLHAFRYIFIHPESGKQNVVECPIPAVVKKIFS